jgi:hypothetical protein
LGGGEYPVCIYEVTWGIPGFSYINVTAMAGTMGCTTPGYTRGRERASTTTGALHDIFIFFLHLLLSNVTDTPEFIATCITNEGPCLFTSLQSSSQSVCAARSKPVLTVIELALPIPRKAL